MDKLQPEEIVIIEEPQESRAVRPEKRHDRFLAVSILIAGVFIGGSILFSTLYKAGVVAPAGGAGGANAGGVAAENNGAATSTINSNVMVSDPRDAVLGSASAPVTLIEYGDYQCPFCAQFFSQTESQIITNYVNQGTVKMVFRNFAFLGPESTAAAAAAECANDQGKLWPYHDALYTAKVKDEQNGGNENDGYYSRALFLTLAQQVGLNTATFTSCIDTNKYSALVAKEKTDGMAEGVNSTPTFYVNGQQVLGAQPYSVFQSTIDGILKG